MISGRRRLVLCQPPPAFLSWLSGQTTPSGVGGQIGCQRFSASSSSSGIGTVRGFPDLVSSP
ncbi:MAG: hypothetical protein U0787_14635 [Polyangia bacterium]